MKMKNILAATAVSAAFFAPMAAHADDNALHLFWKDGNKTLALKSKTDLAADLVNEIVAHYQKNLSF